MIVKGSKFNVLYYTGSFMAGRPVDMELSECGCWIPIWHIHDEVHKPNSMAMGHYYDGILLRKIEDYLAGVMSRLKVLYNKEVNPILAKSWGDLFPLGDVHWFFHELRRD